MLCSATLHCVVGDLLLASAKLLRQHTERFAGERGVDVHAPAEEGVGEHGAADDVCVGDRRFRAAAPVAGGTGLGAGRSRPDPQHAAVVAPHDRAAPGAHRHDVEHRGADGEPVDLGVAREDRDPVAHETHVGARAPHVEGDEVAVARALRLADRAHHPRRRTGEQGGDRVLGHAARGQAPAVRLHQAEPARERPRIELALEFLQVAIDDGLDVRREGGGRRALVFAELARHVARAGDADAGKALGDDLCNAPLVDGVCVAVQEADRDRFVAGAFQRAADTILRRCFVESGDDLPVRSHALRDLERVAARDHRRRLPVVDVVDGAPALALQREHVAEALGREECDSGPFALEHRVGRDGRAVHEISGGVHCQTGFVERGDGSAVRLRGCARHLGDAHPIGLECDEIGERAPDLDPHPGRTSHGSPPMSMLISISISMLKRDTLALLVRGGSGHTRIAWRTCRRWCRWRRVPSVHGACARCGAAGCASSRRSICEVCAATAASKRQPMIARWR